VNHPKEQRCANCLYWVAEREGEEWGDCRRRAPLPNMADLIPPNGTPSPSYVAIWPETEESDWCGEWATAAVPQVYGTPTEPPKCGQCNGTGTVSVIQHADQQSVSIMTMPCDACQSGEAKGG
jgi:hypothetical protein